MTTRCPADSKALNKSLAKASALSSPERETVMSTSSFLYGKRPPEALLNGDYCMSMIA
jgi:hypothetical protein